MEPFNRATCTNPALSFSQPVIISPTFPLLFQLIALQRAGGCLPWQTVTMRRSIFEDTMLSCVWRVSVGKCHWVISLLTFPSWRQELHHLLDRAGLPRATQPCRFLFTSALFVTNQGFFCEHLISKSAIPYKLQYTTRNNSFQCCISNLSKLCRIEGRKSLALHHCSALAVSLLAPSGALKIAPGRYPTIPSQSHPNVALSVQNH